MECENGKLSERKAAQSYSEQIKFIFHEKRHKSDSNAREKVESPKTSPNLPTSIDSKHRKSGFDPAWLFAVRTPPGLPKILARILCTYVLFCNPVNDIHLAITSIKLTSVQNNKLLNNRSSIAVCLLSRFPQQYPAH